MLGFRPTLWPTLITIPALAILLALGTWQLQRLEWKTALIAEREAALQAPPVALPDDPAALRQMDFRRIRVSGEFLHGRSLLLSARSYQGRPGSHLLTPLRLETGRVLMVNRGWIPLDATPSSPAIARRSACGSSASWSTSASPGARTSSPAETTRRGAARTSSGATTSSRATC